MKKIFKIVIVMLLSINSTLVSMNYFPMVANASSLSSKYFDLLSEQVDMYGISSSNSNNFQGVVYVKVADFDKNGSDELYMVVLTSSEYESSYIEYLYEGDILVYTNEINGPNSSLLEDASLSIAEGKYGIYLSQFGEYSTGGFELGQGYENSYWNTYFTLENSEVISVLTNDKADFEYNMTTIDEYFNNPDSETYYGQISDRVNRIYTDWDGISTSYEGTEYFINDSLVNEESYNEQLQPYENLEWEEIIVGDAGTNEPAVDSQAIVTQALNELIVLEKPTNLGEDLKDSMDEEIRSSMVEWLMYSQYFGDGYNITQDLSDEELVDYLCDRYVGDEVFEFEYANDLEDTTDFPEYTYARVKEKELDDFISVYLGQSFDAEEFEMGVEYFPFVKKEGYYYYPDYFQGSIVYETLYINGVYEVANDIYYIDFTDYEIEEFQIDELGLVDEDYALSL